MTAFVKGQPVSPGKDKSWWLLKAYYVPRTGQRALLILIIWILTTSLVSQLQLSLQAHLGGTMSHSELPLDGAVF